MQQPFADSLPLATDALGNEDRPYGLSGFRVYKRYDDKKRYERDFRRRLRNLKVVEARFAGELKCSNNSNAVSDDVLLTQFFADMAGIRPQLLNYLQKSPGSLVEHFRRFFGVPVYLESSDQLAEYPGRSQVTLTDVTDAMSIIAAPSASGDNDSLTHPMAAVTPEMLNSVLQTLSHKDQTISQLETEISDLTQENIELAMKLETAYSDLFQLDMESARTEQRYLEALTSLTESLHVSAMRCSKLQSLVLRRGTQLAMQSRALFATENALAQQCHLNPIPCPAFSKSGVSFGRLLENSHMFSSVADSDLASSDFSNASEPRIERFFLYDGDCTTSAYDSDAQGSVSWPGLDSSTSIPGRNLAINSSSFYETGSVVSEFVGGKSPDGSIELVIANFDDHFSLGDNISATRPALPVNSTAPEVIEPTSVDVPAKPSLASGAYALPAPPVTTDNLASASVVATPPLGEFGSAAVNSPDTALDGDTKVRELKTEISVLQKKLQQYLREIRTLKRENERLRPRESMSSDLRAELAAGGVIPFNYSVCEDQVAVGSGVPSSSVINPALATSHAPPEDTKVKELKAEISVLQKQIQRYQQAEEDRQRLLDQLGSEERRNHDLNSELAVARRRIAGYQHEVEQLLRSYGGAVYVDERNQSSTAVSQNQDRSSKSGMTMPDLKTVFSSLQERVGFYESENAALRTELAHLRSQLSVLQSDLSNARNENEMLSSDTRAVGCLALERVFYSITSAMESMTRTSIEELETTDSEGMGSAASQIGRHQLLDERVVALESENRLYKDKLSSLMDMLHQSTFERFQMHTTISRLNSDLHCSHQQLQKFRNQSSELLGTSNELDRLRAKCSLYDDQVDRLKQMNADLSDLNNRLADDVRSLEEKSAFAKNEVTALREEIRQLQSLLVGDARIAHDAIRDRVAIIQLEGRCNLLNEALSSNRTELESVRGKNSDLVKLIMELRYALEQERTSNVEYLRQVNAMSEAEGRLRNQLDSHETQLEGLRASVASLTESLEKSAADLRAASTRLMEKERSERAMSSTIESLNGSLQTLVSSVREAKPLRLSASELGSIDISGITNFNPSVYYGILDAIQQSMTGVHDGKDVYSVAKEVSSARDKVSNILKCNFLLSTLAAGLCRQLRDLSSSLIDSARSQTGSLSTLMKFMGTSVNVELLRADFANRVGRLQAHNKELSAMVGQLQKCNPADALNRIKDHYEDTLGKCQAKLDQMSSLVKSNEDEHTKLRQENSKLMSDCSSAAKALQEFERRIDKLSDERSSLCKLALSILPAEEQSECERDNLRAILSSVRTLVSSLTSYREKYKKLLENPPEPKIVTVTVPAPISATPNPVSQPAADRGPEAVPAATQGKVNDKVDTKGLSSSAGNPAPRGRLSRRIPPDGVLQLANLLKDIDTNVRYYVKNIKLTLRDHVQRLSSQADNSDTEYESPRSHSIGRSDATVCDGDDPSDSDMDYPTRLYFDKSLSEEVLRRHTRHFESICDLLDKARDAQSHITERPPRIVYVDAPDATTSRLQSSSTCDMVVMHHFQRLCATLKECTVGSPLALTVDDVFYQLELVVLDQGDRDHRRARWDRCIGNMVSVIIDVLHSETLERQGMIDELRRRCTMLSAALDEAESLCRLREDELHRRTCELSDTCNRLEETERHCRKLEVELEVRGSDRPRIDDQELRSLESDLSQREEELRQLNKELSKLHAIVLDLEEVNGLLSQQLSRSRNETERLVSTVEKQQRQISSLNSELSCLELEAERLRRVYT
ncbi:uncharacterized protein BXIN_2540 [Babesia sp. Xinjiang]|uniref:uncharacterized protein n=1 Tax=Babesia sp. Xinjiang TaxID=462227 RepID=UPI000A21C347|nr:uncharacterized protein BXIN_2540 [Babesia sp. Xinjiang]ORM41479.1 hypothetical protein BXIN_2540 [Babesia sp. Xinjiang]